MQRPIHLPAATKTLPKLSSLSLWCSLPTEPHRTFARRENLPKVLRFEREQGRQIHEGQNWQRTCSRCLEARMRAAVGWSDEAGDEARARWDAIRAATGQPTASTAAEFPDEPVADPGMVTGFAKLAATAAERQAAAEAAGMETARQAIPRIAREEEAEEDLVPAWQAGLHRDAAVKFGGRAGRLVDRTGRGAGPSWPPTDFGFVKMRYDDTGAESGLINAADLRPPARLATFAPAAEGKIGPCTHPFAEDCADYHFGREGGPWRCPACSGPLVDATIIAKWEDRQREARDEDAAACGGTGLDFGGDLPIMPSDCVDSG